MAFAQKSRQLILYLSLNAFAVIDITLGNLLGDWRGSLFSINVLAIIIMLRISHYKPIRSMVERRLIVHQDVGLNPM